MRRLAPALPGAGPQRRGPAAARRRGLLRLRITTAAATPLPLPVLPPARLGTQSHRLCASRPALLPRRGGRGLDEDAGKQAPLRSGAPVECDGRAPLPLPSRWLLFGKTPGICVCTGCQSVNRQSVKCSIDRAAINFWAPYHTAGARTGAAAARESVESGRELSTESVHEGDPSNVLTIVPVPAPKHPLPFHMTTQSRRGAGAHDKERATRPAESRCGDWGVEGATHTRTHERATRRDEAAGGGR